jgi:hypothetical protein
MRSSIASTLASSSTMKSRPRGVAPHARRGELRPAWRRRCGQRDPEKRPRARRVLSTVIGTAGTGMIRWQIESLSPVPRPMALKWCEEGIEDPLPEPRW